MRRGLEGPVMSVLSPREKSSRPAAGPTAPPSGAPATDLRVLLLEDDPGARQILLDVVREYQPAATVDCLSLEQAKLEDIMRAKYDVVFSDIRAPATIVLAQLARTRNVRPHTPTHLITWHDDRELAAQALRGGAYDFLRKPPAG